jgi:hypothetical protein
MNASEPFGLSNGYAYNPSAVEFNAAVMVTMNVHSIHFRNQSISLNENKAIKLLIESRKELQRVQDRLYFVEFQGGGGITYWTPWLAASIGTYFVLSPGPGYL